MKDVLVSVIIPSYNAKETLAQAVESARTAFELVSAKYENGKAGITEFNESRNGYIKACSDLAQARYENLYMCKLLEFYRGRELDF